MKIDDFLIRTTIRIESYTDNGIATGTGFFFNFTKNGDDIIPVIVTNKHVVKNGKLGKLVFSIIDKNDEIINGEKYSVNFHDFEKAWIKHPDDNVDLCVLPIAQICDSAIASGKKLAISCLIKDNIISDEYIKNISKVEDIAVVGYPDGIWDSYNNLPIVRKGITATPISYNFENKKLKTIDELVCDYEFYLTKYPNKLKEIKTFYATLITEKYLDNESFTISNSFKNLINIGLNLKKKTLKELKQIHPIKFHSNLLKSNYIHEQQNVIKNFESSLKGLF